MQYKIGLDLNACKAWGEFLASTPNANFRQACAWGTIRKLAGWEPIYVYVEENGQVVATLLIFSRKIPVLGMSIFYGCRGPILDWSNTRALDVLMQGVRKVARQRKAIFLRVDPEPGPDQEYLRQTMKHAGFELLEREFTAWNRTQYELRVILDTSEEELLKGMRRTLRQEINASKRKGVSIATQVQIEDEDRFCELMSGLENVKNSVHHSQRYYQTVLREILKSGGMLVKACYEGQTIAVMTLVFVGDRCWAVYMANDYEYRKLNPNKLLMWEGIRIAKSRGCVFFDMGATQAKAFDQNDPLDKYKLGFRPNVVRFPGFFDYPFYSLLYRGFIVSESKVIPWVHRIMRHKTGAGK